jgi:hypothetical protein
VAAEVRKLAERSQQAANEINKVSGKTISSSRETREMLLALAPEIERTAGLVQEISIASLEQVSGVEQINNALQQLNQVTQRNASNSEEINAAAQRIDKLSERLEKAISVFSLHQEDLSDNTENTIVQQTGDLKPTPVSAHNKYEEGASCAISEEQLKERARNVKRDFNNKDLDSDDYEKF